ncbi:MAG: co-chaperone GroES [Eggerthellaceae bacterium]|nr:co-chaperone GroES [Eggerthellaceae bacterium]
MNLRPLGDRVIIRQDEAQTATAGGLLIASSSQEKPSSGIVLAVGEGKLDNNGTLIKPSVSEGDRVLYSKYSGTEVTVDGEEVIILRADDIYAVYTA